MTKKIWTYLETDKYNIGLTSKTAYIYNKDGDEVKKFKDLSYAYTGIISPNQELLILKSSEGRIAVYSLSTLELIKKFRFSKVDGSQDDNLIFTPDGKYLLNIERHIDSCQTALSIYNTNDFSLIKRLFSEDPNLVLSTIEYDYKSKKYYILGFIRNFNTGCAEKYFVCRLIDEKLQDIKYISEGTFSFYDFAKKLELCGFTEEAYKWLYVFKIVSLEELKKSNISLATLWIGIIE